MTDKWNKIMIMTNISLVIVTGVYVIFTWHMVSETKEQTELMGKGYQESLRPYLLLRLDSLQYHHPKSMVGRLYISNEGETPAECVLLSINVLPFSGSQIDMRDTLLYADTISLRGTEIMERFSRFVPMHHSTEYVLVLKDALAKPKTDSDVFFIHVLILYQDAFKSYYDTYCVFKFDLDWKLWQLRVSPSTYDFHTYTTNEINKIYRLLKEQGKYN